MAGSRGNYKSKHYDELLAWFSTIPGQHVTTQEIYAHFVSSGITVGMTTLYRLLDRLTEEGLVAKYTVDSTSPACFEFIAGSKEKPESFLYHCKCEMCGKLIHLQCDEIKELQEHLLREHHFLLNPKRTVLYGVCNDCLKKQAKDAQGF